MSGVVGRAPRHHSLTRYDIRAPACDEAELALLPHEVGGRFGSLVPLDAEGALQPVRFARGGVSAFLGVAHDHGDGARESGRRKGSGAFVLPSIVRTGFPTETAYTVHVPLHFLVRLLRRGLLHSLVEEVILPLPVAALRKGLEVPFDAPPYHDHALGLELGLGVRNLIQQCRRSLAPYSPGAVHHHGLILQLVLRLRCVQPLGKVLARPHLRIEQRGPSLRRIESPDVALVRVPHVDDDRVLLLHLLVVLRCLQMSTRMPVERRSLHPVESVSHELVHLAQGEGAKALLGRDPVLQLEVGAVEKFRVPRAERVAERAHVVGARGEGAVEALGGASSSAGDVVSRRQFVDLVQCRPVLSGGPRRLLVLVEEADGATATGQVFGRSGEGSVGVGFGRGQFHGGGREAEFASGRGGFGGEGFAEGSAGFFASLFRGDGFFSFVFHCGW
mmetsp:Transcript_27643/g.59425  ORF Transcript_27643/g.59425 Transcript_27643/m.59425 type:complete len:446 (+) Transcript_27643:643-1980(+)